MENAKGTDIVSTLCIETSGGLLFSFLKMPDQGNGDDAMQSEVLKEKKRQLRHDMLFILVYSDQRSCAIRPAIPKVSGHRSRSIRPSFLSIRPTAGTSRLECTMN